MLVACKYVFLNVLKRELKNIRLIEGLHCQREFQRLRESNASIYVSRCPLVGARVHKACTLLQLPVWERDAVFFTHSLTHLLWIYYHGSGKCI